MIKTYTERLTPCQLELQKKYSAMLEIDKIYFQAIKFGDQIYCATAYEKINDIIEKNKLCLSRYSDILNHIKEKENS
jgi:hypothetical protein